MNCEHKKTGRYRQYKLPSLNAEENIGWAFHDFSGMEEYDRPPHLMFKDRTYDELNDEQKKEVDEKKCLRC